MKGLKITLMSVLVFCGCFLVSFSALGAEYYFGPGDDLLGIDYKKSINDGNIELSVIRYVSQRDLRLAKNFIRECLRETPKTDPFYLDLKKAMKDLNNLKIAPDTEIVLALAAAQADSEKIILSCRGK